MLRSAIAIALLGVAVAAPAAGELPEPQRHGDWCARGGCVPRAGSSVGYAAGFGHLLVVPLNMFIESVLVLIFYPLFVLSWRNLVVSKRLGSYMKRIRRRAERHEALINRFGIIGLFAFVWLPPSTRTAAAGPS